LANIFRAKSPDMETWFSVRTTFTTSLAVMSMAGYLLGLGDRHPSNLMLQRGTGRVVHIDFGDCFEVAMLRDKFPERVPFRLTRMLIKAMEVRIPYMDINWCRSAALKARSGTHASRSWRRCASTRIAC
jgi:FKBP12-rapamycin complex-associated protein